MVNLKRRILTALFLASTLAIAATAAPIPTPAPGSAQPLAQPSPVNPVQYVVAPGAIGSSAQLNSTFYKVYTDLAAITALLNSCSFIPDAAIGTIAAISPLNVSIATCAAGLGVGSTATLSLTGVVPQANLPTTPTFTAVISKANGTIAGYTPPVYTAAGALTAATEHIVRGSTTVSVASGQAGGSAAVAFTGAAMFTSAASYQVTTSINISGGTYPPGWVAYGGLTVFCGSKGTSSFSVFVYNPNVSTNVGNIVVDWTAVGT